MILQDGSPISEIRERVSVGIATIPGLINQRYDNFFPHNKLGFRLERDKARVSSHKEAHKSSLLENRHRRLRGDTFVFL